MKRTLLVIAAAVAALAAASFAVARTLDDAATVRSLAGTFSATSASNVHTRTCTTTDGKTLVTSTGTFAGTAAGDADLTGPVTLKTRAVIDQTDGAGLVSGTLRIDASGEDTLAHFDAVYASGQIAGLATGHAHQPHARLVANLSAAFDPSAGFTNGKLGGGTAGGGAVELTAGRCQRTIKETSRANGLVTAVSSGSITVAGLTCTVPASLQAAVAALAVNAHAEIHCALSGGTNTLVSVHARK
jgi:hypothetical protein